MHWLRLRAFFVALAFLVAGCSSGVSTSPSGPPSSTPPDIAYVVNYYADTISAYYLDSSSGAMAALTQSPYQTAIQYPWPVVLHPSGDYLYVGDVVVGAIEVFSTNLGAGDLNKVDVTFLQDSMNWLTGMAITPNGNYLYAASNTELDAFSILPDGSLVPLSYSPIAFPGSALQSAVIDPGGHYLYLVDGGTTGRIFAFSINNDGSLTAVPGSPFLTPVPLTPAVFENGGIYLYAADSSNHLYGFQKSANGALTPVAGFPISTPTSTQSIALAFDPTNHWMYASLTPGDAIAAYSLNGTTGALTPIAGSPFSTGHGPHGLAFDGSGKFLYVTNYIDDTVTAYSIANNGTLSFSDIDNTGSGPGSIVILH